MNAVDLASPLLALGLALAAASSGSGQHLLRSHDKSWASFECKNATTPVEKLICGDGDLSQWDGLNDFTYQRLLLHAPVAERPAIRVRQRDWLKRRNACTNRQCVLNLYIARDESLGKELERWDRILRRPVSRIGQCQTTAIEYIGPRLGWVPTSHDRPSDDGTSVGFANGVDLVSYEYERTVARSRIGDHARVCLVSIPKHCPPGDDRGREYAVTNLRTGGKWRMPDSEHMCGGA